MADAGGWFSWIPGLGKAGPVKPMKPTDAMHHPIVEQNFRQVLDYTNPPKTFTLEAVAQTMKFSELQTLGYEKWQEVMPALVELAFEMRALGDCEILGGKKVLGEDVTPYDVEGGVRIRRLAG